MLNRKIHLAVDAHGMPLKYLMADRAYDTNSILNYLRENNAQVVIPAKRNRKTKRPYDKSLYEYRYLVENAFLKLKQFRGVAACYAKSVSCFSGAIHLAAIVLWLRVLV